MRVKLVPPPPEDLSAVADAQRAVPLVPRSESDCCAALAGSLDLESRDVARTWLTFLRALGLVAESQRGFVRTEVRPDRETIATGLREGIFPAGEVLDALGEEPLSVEATFERVEGCIPRWERAKSRDWEGTWESRIEHLLGWLVLAELATRADGGYVRA